MGAQLPSGEELCGLQDRRSGQRCVRVGAEQRRVPVRRTQPAARRADLPHIPRGVSEDFSFKKSEIPIKIKIFIGCG